MNMMNYEQAKEYLEKDNSPTTNNKMTAYEHYKGKIIDRVWDDDYQRKIRLILDKVKI